jgi:hypothetical protein
MRMLVERPYVILYEIFPDAKTRRRRESTSFAASTDAAI